MASAGHLDVCPSRWCITRKDLEVFEREVRELYEAGGIPDDPARPNPFHADADIGPNMYRVNECYIKPRTAAAGTSWALMRNPDGLPCDVFVSHCWSEGVFEFARKVRQLWPCDANHLYCCFVSNPQNGDVGAMLGRNPMESPFARALATAKYVLVIPNRRQSLYTRLWCVFEIHLALKRGLIIRMPWQLSARRCVLELMPGCLFFVVGCALGYLRCDPSWFFDGRQVIGICVVIGLRSIWTCLPQCCFWSTLLVLGALAGLVAAMAFNEPSDMPIPARVPVVDMAFIIIVAAFDSVQHIGCHLMTEAVSKEGCQLEFDTVRNAEATDPRDELQIRETIRGYEDQIDDSIRALKAIGRYDKAVRFNIDYGMSLEDIQQGFQSVLLVGGLYLWLIPLLQPLGLEGPGHMCPAAIRATSFSVLAAVVAGASVTLKVVGKGYYRDYAAFATKAFFWAGVVRHLAVGILDLCTVKGTWIAISSKDGGEINYAVFAGCFASALAAIALFYCGRRCAQARACLGIRKKLSRSWTGTWHGADSSSSDNSSIGSS